MDEQSFATSNALNAIQNVIDRCLTAPEQVDARARVTARGQAESRDASCGPLVTSDPSLKRTVRINYHHRFVHSIHPSIPPCRLVCNHIPPRLQLPPPSSHLSPALPPPPRPVSSQQPTRRQPSTTRSTTNTTSYPSSRFKTPSMPCH